MEPSSLYSVARDSGCLHIPCEICEGVSIMKKLYAKGRLGPGMS